MNRDAGESKAGKVKVLSALGEISARRNWWEQK
jgi:hypothetical protein